MSDSSQTKRDYKLAIEKRPLGFLCSYMIVMTFIMCGALCFFWKKYQDHRGIQWKSNSSYYSSLGRISAALQNLGKGDITFIGSSISGRIAGAESGVEQYYNLSVDASSAKEGISYILSGEIFPSDYLAVELNTLMLDRPFVLENIKALAKERKWHKLLPFTDPLYRTSTLLYTELRNERLDPDDFDTWPITPESEKTVAASSYVPSPAEENILKLLQQVRSKIGSKLILVAYPTLDRADPGNAEMSRRGEWLSKELKTPFLDLNKRLLPSVKISFSDRVHMKSRDAFIAANTIYDYADRTYNRY